MAEADDDTDPAVADTHASTGASAASSSAPRGPRSVRPGDTLGRYELGDELGEGGMATVFRARDKELRRDVALKVLFPHLARRDELVRRFHREARAAAGLEQANILRIYDVGGAVGDDPPYIVMELVRGRSLLAEIEQRGPMLAEVCACIGALLADALAAAHKASIVHRDMKPANVMIAPGGRILLTDFGVARLETEDSLVTKTGALLGTPAYMSPEQASGDTATAKSDLYSLGATLYQLATGTLPYAGSPAKVLAQIAVGAMTAPAKKRPAVGPDLSQIIVRLMAPEPEQRLASAVATATELRGIVAASGLGEPADELAAYFADPDKYIADKMPTVVTRTVAAAKAALVDGKLPRALGLADRAGALAPNDPEVAALIDRVAEGGRATRRRNVLAVVAAGLLVAGGGTLAAVKLLGGAHGAAAVADARDAAAHDATAPDAAIPNAHVDDAELLDAYEAPPDATKFVKQRDAGVARDAVIAMGVSPEAGIEPRDAGEIERPDAPAAPAMGSIIVKNDSYCELSIDGESKGRWWPATAKPYPVTAGRHTVLCAKQGLGEWTLQVDVPAGGSVLAAGTTVGTVEVTFDVDAAVEGVPHRKGTTARLKGRHQVEVGGNRIYWTFNADCHLKADLACYANP